MNQQKFTYILSKKKMCMVNEGFEDGDHSPLYVGMECVTRIFTRKASRRCASLRPLSCWGGQLPGRWMRTG